MENLSMVRGLLAAVGGPLAPPDNKKSWLARIAARAEISPRLAASIYYGEQPLSRAAEHKLKAAAGNYEAECLATQLERAADALGRSLPQNDCADVALLRRAVGALRRRAGAVRRMAGA